MPPPLDLTGHKYGLLSVIDEVLPRLYPRKWNCLCDCGTLKEVSGALMRNGSSKSCGCLLLTRPKEVHGTHGETKSKLHRAWCNMLSRCNNPNSTGYENYGGRGVVVCDAWADSFEAFRDWANQNGYSEELTLDRKENALVYAPMTCRWVSMTIQGRNKRKRRNTSSDFIGVSLPMANNKYRSIIQVDGKAIRLGAYDDPKTAARVRDQYILDNNLEGFTLNF